MGRPWTEDELNRACALRREGKSSCTIGRILNRHASNVSRQLATRGFPRMVGNKWGLKIAEAPAPEPPSQQEVERRALLDARAAQDPISAMLGDPPPGWSALDRGGRGVAP